MLTADVSPPAADRVLPVLLERRWLEAAVVSASSTVSLVLPVTGASSFARRARCTGAAVVGFVVAVGNVVVFVAAVGKVVGFGFGGAADGAVVSSADSAWAVGAGVSPLSLAVD